MYYFSGPQTRKCKILELEKSLYTTILAYDVDHHNYLMITIFPNWNGLMPEKGDLGYIEFEFVKGGVDTYYDKSQNQNFVYSNTYLFFRKFIKESTITQNDEIII